MKKLHLVLKSLVIEQHMICERLGKLDKELADLQMKPWLIFWCIDALERDFNSIFSR
jgi:hypothetical protein